MTDQTVSARTTIAAPPHVVFAIVADPHQHPRIDGSGSVRAVVDGPDRLEKGAKFHVSMKLFGLPYKITNHVVEFEPDRRIAWRHFGGHRWRYELEPDRRRRHRGRRDVRLLALLARVGRRSSRCSASRSGTGAASRAPCSGSRPPPRPTPSGGPEATMSAVRVERSGPVTTVVLSRPDEAQRRRRPDRAGAGRRVPRLRRGRLGARSRCCTATAARSAPAPT